MAKKKENKVNETPKNEVVEKKVNVVNEDNSEKKVQEKNEDSKVETNIITSLSISELMYYEKAAALICRRYENNIKQYDGSIRHSGIEYERFKKTNDLHFRILNEIEKRLNALI